MLRGLFITGTDTNVGKTIVAAALMHRYRDRRLLLKYWKPIQTGIEVDDDTQTVYELSRCQPKEVHRAGIRLPLPLAPYLSAELSRTRVAVADAIAKLNNEPDVRWIVEGAGGVLVPINEKEAMIDLIAALKLPVLIVARSSLGTINHTLLTLEALRHRKLEIAGVVMVGQKNPSNRAAIEKFGEVTVADEVPHFANLSAETLGAWAMSAFDTGGKLASYFR